MWIQALCRNLFMFGLVLYFISDTSSTPFKRFILQDCSDTVDCENETVASICATDDNTYDNRCMLDQLNQNRSCDEGNFNPIAFVHDGPCDQS